MKSQLSQEATVKVPAKEFWEVYRGLERPRILHELKPDYVGKPEVIEGDGGVGTRVKIGTPTGTFWGDSHTIELYKRIDDEKRIFELEIVEGGIKLLGFDQCNLRLEIIEKDVETTVVRSTLDFEIDDKLVHNIPLVKMEYFQTVAEIIAEHLNQKRAETTAAACH